jgi:hypothetical protein
MQPGEYWHRGIAGTPRASQAEHKGSDARERMAVLKVTPETLAQFIAIADREKWLAETLEYALDALDAEGSPPAIRTPSALAQY